MSTDRVDLAERTEYRAIYRRHPSFLDTPEEQAVGYVEHATDYGISKSAVRMANYSLRRTEETRAWIVRWERRTVTVGEWETE